MKDFATRQKFIELRAAGLSFEKIADELKCSKPTLIEWSKEHNREISNLRALELDALQNEFYVAKEKRIRALGQLVSRVLEELENRKLADTQTEKLIDTLLKLFVFLRAEYIKTELTSEQDLDDIVRESLKNESKWEF